MCVCECVCDTCLLETVEGEWRRCMCACVCMRKDAWACVRAPRESSLKRDALDSGQQRGESKQVKEGELVSWT